MTLGEPVVVVELEGLASVATGGTAQLGVAATGKALPLLAHVPPLHPRQLGDATFREAHRVEAAYVVGEMANGIASEALVEAAARAGFCV